MTNNASTSNSKKLKQDLQSCSQMIGATVEKILRVLLSAGIFKQTCYLTDPHWIKTDLWSCAFQVTGFWHICYCFITSITIWLSSLLLYLVPYWKHIRNLEKTSRCHWALEFPAGSKKHREDPEECSRAEEHWDLSPWFYEYNSPAVVSFREFQVKLPPDAQCNKIKWYKI